MTTSSQRALDKWLEAMLNFDYIDTPEDRGYREALLAVQNAINKFKQLDNSRAENLEL